ncbi:MAG: hypothetical protein WBD81_10015 [Collimonas pratensis]|uniref:hypothetical protein n=1 Tax=Collimonas pratensis TaxID=279113 RepID=UPI003C753430
MTKFSLLFIVCAINVGYAHADGTISTKKTSPAASVSSTDASRCTSDPCANTPTGEDQYVIDAREAAAYNKKVLEAGTDQQRWNQFRLYSDSKDPNRLKVPMILAIGLEMKLDPKKGDISIEKSGQKQVFKIDDSVRSGASTCPKYSVRILDASSTYAMIEKSCSISEYAPGKYNMGVDYYLYDMQTATLRSVWEGSSTEKASPFPRPKPAPQVKKISNGYQLDWSATDPSNKQDGKINIHTKYVREKDRQTGKTELVCIDLTAAKDEEHGGACEGGILPLILNQMAQTQ